MKEVPVTVLLAVDDSADPLSVRDEFACHLADLRGIISQEGWEHWPSIRGMRVVQPT